MTAIQKAADLYRQHLPASDLTTELALYLQNGYVFSFPHLFAMARPVQAWAPEQWISDPTHEFAVSDAWYVHLAIGDLAELVRLMPFPAPFICFYRKFRGGLKIHPWADFRRRCHVG